MKGIRGIRFIAQCLYLTHYPFFISNLLQVLRLPAIYFILPLYLWQFYYLNIQKVWENSTQNCRKWPLLKNNLLISFDAMENFDEQD
jgi:hypothetical protein